MATAVLRHFGNLWIWLRGGRVAPKIARRSRKPALRACLGLLATCGAAAILCLIGFGLLLARLAQGPIEIDGAAQRIADALNQRFGGVYRFDIAAVRLENGADGLALTLDQLAIGGPAGEKLVSAPKAHMSFDPLALALGRIAPRWLEVTGVDLHVQLDESQARVFAGPAAPLDPPVPWTPDESAAAAQPVGDMARAAQALAQVADMLSGPDSPLNAVERLGVARGRLIVEDSAKRTIAAFHAVDLTLERLPRAIRLELKADGPNGRWRAEAEMSRAHDSGQTFEVKLTDLSFDEIALAVGLRQPGFILDAPISANGTMRLNADGGIAEAQARILLGAGLFKPDNRDSEPALFDEIAASLRYDAPTRKIIVESVGFDGGETHVEVEGTVEPPDGEAESWRIALAVRPGSGFAPERPNEKFIAIGAGTAALRLLPKAKALVIDALAITGPDLNIEISGQIDGGEAPHLALVMSGKDMPILNLLRLWPSDAAAPVRAWLLQHVLAGKLESFSAALDFDAETLRRLAHELPAPEDSVHFSGRVSNGSIWFLPGLPPVTQMDGAGSVSARKVAIDVTHGAIDAGGGRRMSVGESRFTIADSSVKPTPANVVAYLSGSLDTLSELLAADSLKAFGGLPLDAALIKGQVDGVLAVDLKLGRPPGAEEAQVRVNAAVSNFIAEKLIGKERLENGSLTVTADRAGLRASGGGRMFGAPATLEIRRAPGDTGSAVIGVSFDEAARKQLGLAFAGLGGAVAARIEAPLGQTAIANAKVELDLARTELNFPLLGVSKALGKPGSARFQFNAAAKGATLDNLEADIGPVTLRGQALMTPEGGLASAKLRQFRLAPGDDLKLDISRAGESLKLVARGGAFDARALLQSISHPPPEPSGAKEQLDLDLDLKAARILGANKESLSGAELRLARKGGALRQFQLAGALGAKPISGELTGPNSIRLRGENAGGLLAFLDLYKRMEGGTLDLSVRLDDSGAEGQALIHDFALRDEPALRRLVSEGDAARTDGNATSPVFDPGRVEFEKLEAGFKRTGGRLDIRDGIMYGQQIGTSLDGFVDFARNVVDVRGTFVPAFGLNNFFARIPLFGPLLGGGAHEGLFAVNFRISGPASGPTLNINPLSAIAPGFLRKIFGAGDIPSAFRPKSLTR